MPFNKVGPVVILLILFAVLLALSTAKLPPPSLLDRCTTMSGPALRNAARYGYTWSSNDEIIGLNACGKLFAYDINTRSERDLPRLNERLKELGAQGPITLSAHRGYLLIYNYGSVPSNRLSALATLDGDIISTDISQAGAAYIFWNPSSPSWLEIPYDLRNQAAVRRLDRFAPAAPVGLTAPELPIGFVSESVFVSATNPPGSFPEDIYIEYRSLTDEARGKRTKHVRINGEGIALARTSPSGKRIVWECYSKTVLPRVERLHTFPFFAFARRNCTKLYVSSDTAEEFRILGEVPGGDAFGITWTPDSKSITFPFHDDLYRLRVD